MAKAKTWTEYYIKVFLFDLETILVMCILSAIFDNWEFAIICSIITNIIRKYTYGFHFKTLWYCTIFTNISFILFGYMAKNTVDYLWFPMLLALIFIKEMWLKTPLKDMDKPYNKRWYNRKHFKWLTTTLHINIDKLNVPYDKMYCKKHFGIVMFIIGLVCLFCLYFDMKYILSCILWSIIMTAMVCFINDTEW